MILSAHYTKCLSYYCSFLQRFSHLLHSQIFLKKKTLCYPYKNDVFLITKYTNNVVIDV